MSQKSNTIKVTYEQVKEVSKEEAELRINKAFNILFDAILKNIKNEDKK